jgi:hypothetical protein
LGSAWAARDVEPEDAPVSSWPRRILKQDPEAGSVGHAGLATQDAVTLYSPRRILGHAGCGVVQVTLYSPGRIQKHLMCGHEPGGRPAWTSTEPGGRPAWTSTEPGGRPAWTSTECIEINGLEDAVELAVCLFVKFESQK